MSLQRFIRNAKKQDADTSRLEDFEREQKKKQGDNAVTALMNKINGDTEMSDIDFDEDENVTFTYAFIQHPTSVSISSAFALFVFPGRESHLPIEKVTNPIYTKHFDGVGSILAFNSGELMNDIIHSNVEQSPQFSTAVQDRVIMPVDKAYVDSLKFETIHIWDAQGLSEAAIRAGLPPAPTCLVSEVTQKQDVKGSPFFIVSVTNYNSFCSNGIGRIGSSLYRVSTPKSNAVTLSCFAPGIIPKICASPTKLGLLLARRSGEEDLAVISIELARKPDLSLSGRAVIELSSVQARAAALKCASFIFQGNTVKIDLYEY